MDWWCHCIDPSSKNRSHIDPVMTVLRVQNMFLSAEIVKIYTNLVLNAW